MNNPGEPLIPQCETHKVGNTTYINVPGPIPVIKARRRGMNEQQLNHLNTFLKSSELTAESGYLDSPEDDHVEEMYYYGRLQAYREVIAFMEKI